jgi:uncharacterized protein YggE
MPVTFTPTHRALALGGTAAAVLIGVFALGAGTGSAAPSPAGQNRSGVAARTLAATPAGPARITVTGTGTVNGTPSQLILSMGVQVNAASVGSALTEANQAVSRVTSALKAQGVPQADIQTSNLDIQPNFRGRSQTPVGYAVTESLNATLNGLGTAGSRIGDAVRAGGNVATVDGISLNLTDTSSLLARARTAAVADARTKATQYARALGETLGPIVSITDHAPAEPFLPEASSAAAPRSSAVPISPGTQQLSVTVTAVYSLS